MSITYSHFVLFYKKIHKFQKLNKLQNTGSNFSLLQIALIIKCLFLVFYIECMLQRKTMRDILITI